MAGFWLADSSWALLRVCFSLILELVSSCPQYCWINLSGGLFPGIVLYLSSFYKRHSLQLRYALMFSVTSLAGAFSGLLAAAIQNMHGIRGLPGWAWIFVLVRLALVFPSCLLITHLFVA